MAERYYNAAVGAMHPDNVAEGASDTSLFMCLRITYTLTNANKMLALEALDAVKQYIERDNWPPA